MPNINDAITQAREAAGQIMDAEVTSQTLPATSGGLTLNTGKRSMASVGISGGIANQVDSWLKIDEFGFCFDKDKGHFEELILEVNMTEDVGFFVKDSIKWGNTPVNYASCYDGNKSDKGLPWDETVARAMRVDPACKGPYPSADIVFKTTERIALKEKGKFVEADTKVGFTLATSHWRNWETFYKACVAKGHLGTTLRIKATATSVTRNGNTWGVPVFTLLG
jgi:hypothetical protein